MLNENDNTVTTDGEVLVTNDATVEAVVAEVNDSGRELIREVARAEIVEESINELEQIEAALESYSERGINADSARLMQLHLNSISKRTGVTITSPAIESFGLTSDMSLATQDSLESIKETIENIIQAFIRFITDLGRRIAAFGHSLLNSYSRMGDDYKSLGDELKTLMETQAKNKTQPYIDELGKDENLIHVRGARYLYRGGRNIVAEIPSMIRRGDKDQGLRAGSELRRQAEINHAFSFKDAGDMDEEGVYKQKERINKTIKDFERFADKFSDRKEQGDDNYLYYVTELVGDAEMWVGIRENEGEDATYDIRVERVNLKGNEDEYSKGQPVLELNILKRLIEAAIYFCETQYTLSSKQYRDQRTGKVEKEALKFVRKLERKDAVKAKEVSLLTRKISQISRAHASMDAITGLTYLSLLRTLRLYVKRCLAFHQAKTNA